MADSQKMTPAGHVRRAPGSNRAPAQVFDTARGRTRRGEASDRQLEAPNKGIIEKAEATSKAEIATPSNHMRPKNALLQGNRYAIHVYLWKIADGSQEAKGAILSQSLQKAILDKAPGNYAGDVSLAQMRKLAPGMSCLATIHKFSTSGGVLISDETISFDEYLALDANEDAGGAVHTGTQPAEENAVGSQAKQPKPSVPRLSLYYRSPRSLDYVNRAANTAAAVAPTHDLTLRGQGGNQGAASGGIDANGQSYIPGTNYGDGQGYAGGQGYLGGQGLTGTGGLDLSGASGLAASTLAATVAPTWTGNTYSVSAGTLTETEWSVVLRNCAVFYGWKVDPQTKRIVRAPRAAFRLRTTATYHTPESVSASATEISADAVEPIDGPTQSNEQAQYGADAVKAASQAAAQNGVEAIFAGIPNFRTNDDSRIEVTACADSFTLSLAKSDFSSQCTEASVSGGAMGITAGVSGGVASSKRDGKRDDHTETIQTLLARYMYPRCDLFLRPEDLEPTDEFAALLRRVKNDRSLDALRQIQAQYGQLFCQELTLGARLLSTKTVTTSGDTSMESHKEQFKVSVGVSVQTPYGGASVKHEQEPGSEKQKSTTTTSSRESNVFEASGGDTILANNASVWASSVAVPTLWRVINRDGLSSLVEMLSDMQGYQAAQMWFVQAIPALNKYMRLNASLSTNVRFKVDAPTNSLSIENKENASFYLGCDQGTTVTPRLNGRTTTIDTFWSRIDLKESHVLFNPATYRPPTLHGFEDFAVGDGQFGNKYNSAFTADPRADIKQWELVSPFGVEVPMGSPYELKNMARVILRTVPFRDSATKPTVDGTDPTPPACHLTVFRNAQGAFLPAISDNDEYQYWRIVKTNSDLPGEPVKGNDSVRLCWRFSDQTVGFRDFTNDVFGRRRNQCPPELESTTLFLKVPWPRFEVTNIPTAMIMSAQDDNNHVMESFSTRVGQFEYALQDLRLRIDPVEQRAVGDSNDYMLRGIEQEGDRTVVSFRPGEPSDPMQAWQRIARFRVFW